jgi:hypothetical protein
MSNWILIFSATLGALAVHDFIKLVVNALTNKTIDKEIA